MQLCSCFLSVNKRYGLAGYSIVGYRLKDFSVLILTRPKGLWPGSMLLSSTKRLGVQASIDTNLVFGV